jgi:hypothetical protein
VDAGEHWSRDARVQTPAKEMSKRTDAQPAEGHFLEMLLIESVGETERVRVIPTVGDEDSNLRIAEPPQGEGDDPR